MQEPNSELSLALDNLEELLTTAPPDLIEKGIRIAAEDRNVTIEEFNLHPVLFVRSERRSGRPYRVNFHNLASDYLSFDYQCTCPFYQNNLICKHVLAASEVLFEYCHSLLFQGYRSLPVTTISSIRELSKIEPKALRSLAKNNNAGQKALNHAREGFEDSQLKSFEAGKIVVTIKPATQQSKWDVTLKQTKEGLSAQCQCGKASETSLCWHSLAAFLYTHHYFGPEFFNLTQKSLQTIQDKKAQLLNQYGFSLEDDLTGLFDFVIEGKDRVNLHVLDQGLKPVSHYFNWQDFSKSLAPPKPSPQQAVQHQQEASQFGVGFAIYLPKLTANDAKIGQAAKSYDFIPDFSIVPLKGKLKKKSHAFAGRISPVSIEDVISDTPGLTQEAIQDLQAIHKLQNKELIKTISSSVKNFPKNIQWAFTKDFPEGLLNKIFDTIRQQVLKAFSYLSQAYTVTAFNEQHFTTRNTLAISVSQKPVEIFFDVKEDSTFVKVQMGLQLGETAIHYDDPEFHNVGFVSHWIVHYQDTLYPIGSLEAMKAIYKFEEQGEIKVHKKDFTGFFKHFVEPLTQKFTVNLNLEKEIKEVTIDNPELRVYLKELDNFIIFQPAVDYNGTEMELDGGEAFWTQSEDTLFKINRNPEQEKYLENTLGSLHPNFQKQFNIDYYYLPTEELMKNHWFLEAFQTLRDNGIAIYGQEALANLKFNTNKPSVSMSAGSGIDWFDLEVAISFGDQTVKPKDVRKALQKGENFVKLGDGTYGILPEDWLKKYESLFRHGNVKKDRIEFPKTHFNLLDELHEELEGTSVMKEVEQKKRKLENFRELEQKPLPQGIQADLRDYQKEGFYWLNFLDEFQWGGCLADDMGLGKTLQVLTFLQHKKEQGQTQPSLIVVPTTLIFNWENEIRKFAPDLQYFINWGSSRLKSQEEFDQYDLIIASYDILKNDIELFSGYHFHYVILDEAQAIKNPKSQRFKAATLLNADNRLTLSGTPLENNTFDLYSQMSFLNPGFLGSQENFKSEFATPIDKNKDPDTTQKLRRLVHPFILRRKKEEVEQELPEKVVDLVYCEMDSNQKQVYDAFKNDYREKILQKVDQDGMNNSQFYILEGLLKLRQICDSPALLNEEEDYGDESVKLNEILKHITEKTGEHKILIFSQFVEMLKMLRKELQQTGIDFEYLDGQTQKRQEKVDRFQNEENCRVFLISLKAGGTGLNLTEADYVYIVDPWWNPAVEEQAIDRTHRIGQNKHIFGYKMICKDTIEEKVIELQQKKTQLANEVVSSEQGLVKNLTRDDLAELFT